MPESSVTPSVEMERKNGNQNDFHCFDGNCFLQFPLIFTAKLVHVVYLQY